jgi:hypothetical protein
VTSTAVTIHLDPGQPTPCWIGTFPKRPPLFFWRVFFLQPALAPSRNKWQTFRGLAYWRTGRRTAQWRVRKPGVNGIITRLVGFDVDGERIIPLFDVPWPKPPPS